MLIHTALFIFSLVFFFQAEDGIRDLVRSRGLGDVYKRQLLRQWSTLHPEFAFLPRKFKIAVSGAREDRAATALSLIHI